MEYSITSDNGACVFSLHGDLDFKDSMVIKKMTGEIKKATDSSITLDLSGLTSIDSAGLGMILLVSDAAADTGKGFSVCKASGQVKKMLDISKFGDLMTITD